MTPAALALSCALAASLDGLRPANDNGLAARTPPGDAGTRVVGVSRPKPLTVGVAGHDGRRQLVHEDVPARGERPLDPSVTELVTYPRSIEDIDDHGKWHVEGQEIVHRGMDDQPEQVTRSKLIETFGLELGRSPTPPRLAVGRPDEHPGDLDAERGRELAEKRQGQVHPALDPLDRGEVHADLLGELRLAPLSSDPQLAGSETDFTT